MNSLPLAGRTALAVVLMVGFYVLALGIACGLLLFAVVSVVKLHRLDLRLVIFSAMGAGVLLWSVVPRPDAFEPPGPPLSAAKEPMLFEQVRTIAVATGQPMPQEIYLVADVNAWVAQRGGWLGIGTRRVMGLGLPLVQALSVSELRAVLAHEFGHFHAGDAALGPWIWTTRAAIVRTVDNLSQRGSVLRHPFLWYGRLFLRITHAVSRRQEYSADALAARTEGAGPLATGLEKAHGAAVAIGAYWNNELVPVIRAGYRPPLAEGFALFLASPRVAAVVGERVQRELAASQCDPHDTHPPLPERLAALRALPQQVTKEDPRPAIGLLADVASLERRLLALMMNTDEGERLKPVAWEAVGQTVLLPDWRAMLQKCSLALQGRIVEALPGTRAELELVARSLPDLPGGGEGTERRRLRAAWVLGAAVAMVLVGRGWRVLDLPGAPIILIGPDHPVLTQDADPSTGSLDLSELIGRILEGTLLREDWVGRCRLMGIAGARLDQPATAAATA